MKKKILFIIEGLWGGGAEKALVELLSNFDYTQYDVTLCVVYYGGVYVNQLPKEVKTIFLYDKPQGYFHDSLKRKSFRYFKNSKDTRLMRWWLNWKLRNRKFDTIVSFLEGTSLLYHSFICGRAKKNIAWVHCDLLHYHWTDWLFQDVEQQCYAMMDDIVFVSQNAMQAFEQLYQVPVRKHCIYNVIDTPKIKQLSVTKEVEHRGFTIIAIGSLIKVKGFERLLQVARMFCDNGYDLRFQILGVGEDEQKLRELSHSLGVEHCVEFLGFQKPPYPYLAKADVLVSTSLSEGLPFVICEAFSLGIPVVATRTAGAVELLDGGKYGVLTEHTPESIYSGLKGLVDDEQLLHFYKQKAGERAKIFDVESTLNTVYNLLD